jgi:NAD(P)-dependent dehydrogenase (short-subunit alcohol dehydrogenase family)
MSETQRVAIVTGAAGGIGRAMTKGLLTGIRVASVVTTVVSGITYLVHWARILGRSGQAL